MLRLPQNKLEIEKRKIPTMAYDLQDNALQMT
jgi:hypothetical protein